MAADIFEYSKRVGYHFSLLDIGGGFPGTRDSQDLFRRVTGAINQGLEKHFSALPGLKIIAEPGGERGGGGEGRFGIWLLYFERCCNSYLSQHKFVGH